MHSDHDDILIEGAREHNLRNISVRIPRDRLTVVTGPSGSGKSSLAFDTLFAEGQRRYVESLSAYARQFLDQLRRPDVDRVDNLPPAIAIGQHASANASPRSTVATVTEIMDYLRVLFSIAAEAHCPKCGRRVGRTSAEQMVERLLDFPERTRLTLLAPVARRRKGPVAPHADAARAAGFVRIRVDGVLHDLDDLPDFPAAAPHTVELVVDRLVVKEGVRPRLTDSVELALRHGAGLLAYVARTPDGAEREETLSERNACPDCGIVFDELDASSFSFNSPRGACPVCGGLGHAEGAESPPQGFGDAAPGRCPACHGRRLRPESLAARLRVPGCAEVGIADILSATVSDALRMLSGAAPAPGDAAARGKTGISPSPQDRVLAEIRERLRFLENVGVGYLTLDRESSTLSGGEAQRIRLATQIGSALVGVLYVLDEPTIGLHPRDTARLVRTLRALQSRGNTVVVVEHDADVIREADNVIDMGPGAGRLGGRVLFEGTVPALLKAPESPTGCWLSEASQRPVGELQVPLRTGNCKLQTANAPWLRVRGAKAHNLRRIDVEIPLGRLVAITGVSGSGKSSLLDDVLRPALAAACGPCRARPPFPDTLDALEGAEAIGKVVVIDQSPIGRSPRSNPATYTGAFDEIRALFAQTPMARARGYGPGRFSFNAKGGRCEVCRGDGQIRMEMNFLPDAFVPCPQCAGRRYNRETLEVRYAGRTIADVLDMTVDEACEAFAPFRRLSRSLRTLRDVGLGYLQLGQSAATLSGGEAQRLKLAAELQRPVDASGPPMAAATPRAALYLLDEPTTGLNFADVQRILDVLVRLRDAGHTVLVVEHSLDIIRAADWVVDLGPEGGEAGGLVVAAGPPAAIAACPGSLTGAALRGELSFPAPSAP